MQHLSLIDHLAAIEDPRRPGGHLEHPLVNILAIGFCGVICGCESFTEMHEFGDCKREFFESLLSLEHGIPSHDTFGRVFAAVPPETLMQTLSEWMKQRSASVGSASGKPGVHIDGKAMRGTGRGQALVHLVGAWASEQGLSLGQCMVENKSNEIEAIPHLLEILDLEGTVVTIDAAGTQKTIAKQIIDSKADYVLALKKNHPKLYEAAAERFIEATDRKAAGVKHIRQREQSHGRDETRDYYQMSVPKDLPGRNDWAGLKTLGMVIRTWVDQTSGEEKSAIRYYLSSLRVGVRELAKHVRNHWSVENSLHWVLDVAFREDGCPIANVNAAANLSAMNRIALSALKQDTTCKRGVKTKRKRGGWDNAYLTHILKIAINS